MNLFHFGTGWKKVMMLSVEICVSSEELKKTLEYMALIGAGGLKKKDTDETAGAMRITAVSPKRDYRYMLMFCRMGAAEQLVYRMEGKSRNSNEPVDAYVDASALCSGQNL